MKYIAKYYLFELKHRIEKYFANKQSFLSIIIHLAVLFLIVEISLSLLYYSVVNGQVSIMRKIWQYVLITIIAFITSLNSVYGFQANYTYSQKLLCFIPLSNRVIFVFYYIKSNIIGLLTALTLGIPEIILLSTDWRDSLVFSGYLLLMIPIINSLISSFNFLLSLSSELFIKNSSLTCALRVISNILNYIFAIVIALTVSYISITLSLKRLSGIVLFVILLLFVLLYLAVFDRIFLVFRYNTRNDYSNSITGDRPGLNRFKLLNQAKMDLLILKRNIDYTAYALIRNYMPALLAAIIIFFDNNIRKICIDSLKNNPHSAMLAILWLLTFINCNNYLGVTFFTRFPDTLFCYKYLPVNHKIEILKRSFVLAIPGFGLSTIILVILELQILHSAFSVFLIMLFFLFCSAVYGGVNSVTFGLKSSAHGKISLQNLLRNNPVLFSMSIQNLLLVSAVFLVTARIMLTDILSILLICIVFTFLIAYRIRDLTLSVENIIDSKVI